MKTLQITVEKARQLYPKASDEFKALLEENFSKKDLIGKVTDRIKTYEDACVELGKEPIERHIFDELAIITAALNEGWEPNWDDSNEKKWAPWFRMSSGFAFYDTYYSCSLAYAGRASRLCFKSDELARYAGKQFLDRYEKLMK